MLESEIAHVFTTILVLRMLIVYIYKIKDIQPVALLLCLSVPLTKMIVSTLCILAIV